MGGWVDDHEQDEVVAGGPAVSGALARRALEIREKALGPEHPSVATSLNNLAELYRAQGRKKLRRWNINTSTRSSGEMLQPTPNAMRKMPCTSIRSHPRVFLRAALVSIPNDKYCWS